MTVTGQRMFRWLVAAFAVVLIMAAALHGIRLYSMSRNFQLFGKIVPRVETNEKVVALTFDDGPTPEFTPVVLSVLRKKGVKATFFLIGSETDKNNEQARAIVAEGHELGNHSYWHRNMTLVSEATAKSELERTDAAIRKAGYTGEIFFRPPYCRKLIGLPLYLVKHGRTTVTWDVEPDSDDVIPSDPSLISANVLAKARPGSIILLHVMYKNREATRRALPDVIDGLRERGYRFVTVAELIAMGEGQAPGRFPSGGGGPSIAK